MTEAERGGEVVPMDAAGERLDRWLVGRLPEVSRTRLAQLVREGQVLVDGETAVPSHRLRGAENVTWELPPAAESSLEPEDLPLDILHEDESLVVVNKAAGVVVHPGAGVPGGTLVNALLFHLGERLTGVGGERRPGIVHRLDKGTSGVLVVAKTTEAHEALANQFAARTVDKRYLAITLGVPAPRGRVDAPLARSNSVRTKMAVSQRRGRASLTLWTRSEAFRRTAALVEVELRTGRTHQIRVHLASVGYPLVGDTTYGGQRAKGIRNPALRFLLTRFDRPALHAWRLAFDHPTSGERVAFEAPVPEDFETLLSGLRAWATKLDGNGPEGWRAR